MESYKKTTGNRISALRAERGLTQKELAAKLTVSRELVNLWENDTRQIKGEDIVRLANALGTTCDYLLRGVSTENLDIYATTGLSEAAILKLKEANRDLLKEVTSIPELSRLLETSEFWNLLDKLSLFRHECRVVKYWPAAYTDAKEREDADAMERHKTDWSFAKKDKVILAYEAETSLRRLIDTIEQEVENNGKHHKDD